MKMLPVGEFKAQLSEVLEKVKQGESFGIICGSKKKAVAMIVPYKNKEKKRNERSVCWTEKSIFAFLMISK